MKKENKHTIEWFEWLIAAMAALFLIFGCKTTTKIEKEYVYDTTRVVDVRYDSVDRWHTHYEYILGDTILMRDTFYFDRWHLRNDTIERAVVEYKDREVVTDKEKKVYVWWPCIAISAAVLTAGLFFFFYVKKKSYLCK